MSSPAADATAEREPRVRARASWYAVTAAAVLVAACALVGWWLKQRGPTLHLGTAMPVGGHYGLHLSAWLLAPLALAVATVRYGPALAAALRWSRLLWLAFLAAGAWAVALAVVAGPAAIARPLTTRYEYLHDAGRIAAMDVGTFLSTFTDSILVDAQPGPPWAVHVAGHPPLAALVFATLTRVGLPHAGWAAALCIVAGATAAASVLSTLRLVAGEARARAAAPFVAVAPAALWVATSADAMFAGVAAAGVCALAHAAVARGLRADLLALLGGLTLGAGLYLSYGLVLMAPVALAAVLFARAGAAPARPTTPDGAPWREVVLAVPRGVRPLLVGAGGVAAVVATFTAAGFWWLDGLALVAERMVTSSAWLNRPGWYFLFANAAALAIAVGPAVVAALPLAWRGVREREGRSRRLLILPAAALLALAVATASQLSRGEVERIYLPWTVWLLPLAALLPADRSRRWLAAQVGWAVLVATTTSLAW
jgi:hypothetical protein